MDFDVVLMDCNLPDGDALQILRGLRKRGFAGTVIILTGMEEAEAVPALMRAGAAGCLGKARLDADLIRQSLQPLYLAEM